MTEEFCEDGMLNGVDLLWGGEKVLIARRFYVRPGFQKIFLQINSSLDSLSDPEYYQRMTIPENDFPSNGQSSGLLCYDVIEQWKNEDVHKKFLLWTGEWRRDLEQKLDYVTIRPR